MSLSKEVFARVKELLNEPDNWSGPGFTSDKTLYYIREKNTGIKIWVITGFWFCNFYDESTCLGSFGFWDKVRLWPTVEKIADRVRDRVRKNNFPNF